MKLNNGGEPLKAHEWKRVEEAQQVMDEYWAKKDAEAAAKKARWEFYQEQLAKATIHPPGAHGFSHRAQTARLVDG